MQRRVSHLPYGSGGHQGKERRPSFLDKEASSGALQESEAKLISAINKLQSQEARYKKLLTAHTELECTYEVTKNSFMYMAWQFCLAKCKDFDYIPELQLGLVGACKLSALNLLTT